MGERPAGTSLGRINNNLGYFPGNCCWATPTEQARNSRQTKLMYEGAVQVALRRLAGESLKSVAHDFGISLSTVGSISRGETWKDAFKEANRRRLAA